MLNTPITHDSHSHTIMIIIIIIIIIIVIIIIIIMIMIIKIIINDYYYLPPVVDVSCVGSHSGTVVQLTPHTAHSSNILHIASCQNEQYNS